LRNNEYWSRCACTATRDGDDHRQVAPDVEIVEEIDDPGLRQDQLLEKGLVEDAELLLNADQARRVVERGARLAVHAPRTNWYAMYAGR